MEHAFKEAQRLIEAHDIITIHGHAMPDGDCYGSQIALRNMLLDRYPNKRVYIVGSGIPSFFDLLGKPDIVDDETIAQSLVILVDVSCLRRAEDPRSFNGKSFLKFDHHRPNEGLESFDGVSVVDYRRIAAAEILYEFAEAMGYPVSKLTGSAMYLGIVTDSGRFAYHGTTPRTMEIVNRFRGMGVRTKQIERIAFYRPPRIRNFITYIRRRSKMYRSVRYAVIKAEDCIKRDLTPDEALRLVNSMKVNEPEVHTYCLIVRFNEDLAKAELRSNRSYPVHGVATSFGGGGHRFASGCELNLQKDPDAIERLLKELDQLERNLEDDGA
ncbi:MAG: bifunctional oligoribonuclease/PAP phosphatase NrnA [Bacilli bacterium]|nr:bifunctional oligoribonuclease/PAP phosphatase NrnA [Bacilli bacterium]